MKKLSGKFIGFLSSISQKFGNLFQVLSLKTKINKFSHQTILETVWTLAPVLVILSIAIPSFVLLYAVDVMVDASITIKAIGKQWFWNFELEFPYLSSKDFSVGFKRRIFDSYMLTLDELVIGKLRNLETKVGVMFPLKTHVDLVVTADDVLHSFAIPSAGVKIDAVPGRLNHMGLFLERQGILYGQCSELCGANHGFMPIKAYILPYRIYLFMNDFLNV
jgi:heme/copper-type cytochrome/quinol oxidase subunit 2